MRSAKNPALGRRGAERSAAEWGVGARDLVGLDDVGLDDVGLGLGEAVVKVYCTWFETPNGDVTMTGADPAGCAGVANVSRCGPTTVKSTDDVPTFTCRTTFKKLPCTVTVVPPVLGPDDGESEAMCGAAT